MVKNQKHLEVTSSRNAKTLVLALNIPHKIVWIPQKSINVLRLFNNEVQIGYKNA